MSLTLVRELPLRLPLAIVVFALATVSLQALGLKASPKPVFDEVKVVGEQFTIGPNRRHEPFVASCAKNRGDHDARCPRQQAANESR